MPARININGVITAPEDAKIPVLDHGFLYGDSVYETLRTYRGKPFLFSRHFARLQHSAEGIHLELPWSKERILDELNRTVGAFSDPTGAQRTPLQPEFRIRLIVTRGIGELTPETQTCSDPAVIIIVTLLVELPVHIYKDGVSVVFSSVRRTGPFADIKTGSLIHQVLAFREAQAQRAFEAILLTADGKLSDGITSNIYMVRDGRLLTPSHEAAIVAGITRAAVLDLAREMGMPVVEGMFDIAEIARAEEMFLTSTTREVVPITRVDGKPVGNGRPGPATVRLMAAYRAAVERLIGED